MTMDCKEFREILDLYVDDELSAEASAAARVHLNECLACRRVEQELRRLRADLKQLVARYEPPPELFEEVGKISQSPWRKLMNAARKRTRVGQPLWKQRIVIPAPVFALLLLVIGAFAILALRYEIRGPDTGTTALPRNQNAKPMTSQTDEGAIDLSRFDHGGRASLYKESQ